MEYQKQGDTDWTSGTGNDITGLVPGTYYVRFKATGTSLESDNQVLTISSYVAPISVATPTFSPDGGEYSEEKSVTISCVTDGAKIYYTEDGTEPTSNSKVYSSPISVSKTTTIKAIAVKDGISSGVASASYTINIPVMTYPVTVNNGTGGGNYAAGDAVTITANAPGTGKKFKEWTGVDGLTFTTGSAATPSATFTMPARAVTVTATYEDDQTDPNGGSQTDPNGGNQTDPNGGNQPNPNGGSQTDPNGGSQTDPNGGNQTNPNNGSRNQEASKQTETEAKPVVPPAKKDPITISKTPSSVKAKAKKNKVTVSWKKIKKNKAGKKLLKKIKSIQVQYSTDKTFKQNVKIKTVGKKKTKVTLKLRKKTTYYIRVRYKGAKGFSKWSKVKKVKTKK